MKDWNWKKIFIVIAIIILIAVIIWMFKSSAKLTDLMKQQLQDTVKAGVDNPSSVNPTILSQEIPKNLTFGDLINIVTNIVKEEKTATITTTAT